MLNVVAWAGGSGPRPPESVQRLVQESRSTLGLAHQVIASGHQPGFWHGGILAKHALAQALACAARDQGTDAVAIHVVADHDANDGGLIEYPSRERDGHWSILRERLVAADAGVAWHDREWSGVHTPGEEPSSLPWALGRATALVERLRAAGGTPAIRMAGANLQAIASAAGLASIAESALVTTSALMLSPVGRSLAESALRDPARCAGAWNAAILTAPRTARRLREEAGELPFWVSRPGQRRVRATVASVAQWLDGAPGLHLLPTAFVATGLARLMVDRWIHGRGGMEYERVADLFWRSWLGWTPPPFAVATADLLLPLGEPDSKHANVGATHMPLEQLRRNPELLLDESSRRDRLASAAAIKALPRDSVLRRRAYEELRAAVARHSILARDSLAELESAQREDDRGANDQAITTARTWGAWLLPGEVIRELYSQARHEATALLVSPSA